MRWWLGLAPGMALRLGGCSSDDFGKKLKTLIAIEKAVMPTPTVRSKIEHA
jgi:hypothetical protein